MAVLARPTRANTALFNIAGGALNTIRLGGLEGAISARRLQHRRMICKIAPIKRQAASELWDSKVGKVRDISR